MYTRYNPDPTWNFVFGLASIVERVGVFSFARYAPGFYGEEKGQDDKKKFLLRCCKIMNHETGHMFGLLHCISYKCTMNGSNHLQEFDTQPIYLCPVCLKKLQYSTSFNVIERYNKLQHLYTTFGFTEQSSWIRKQLALRKPHNENVSPPATLKR